MSVQKALRGWLVGFLSTRATGLGSCLAAALVLGACSGDDADIDASEAAQTGTPEIGVISDLDDTVIPPSNPEGSKPPYPGVATLYQILETRRNGQPGDVYYVTARTPERVVEVPAWLEEHGVPGGHIDTGTSGNPFVARPEKIRDIKAILARTGTQKFVLFGDTSHVDPEVQQAILAEHGDRIAAAIMHKVTQTVSPDRVEGLSLVHNYAEAAAALYAKGVINKTEARKVMRAARAEGLDLTTAQMEALLESAPH